MSDELRDNCDVQEFAERIVANKELVESGPRFFTETVRLAEAYLALRRSHAEAVEAAVLEIEAMRNGYKERLDGNLYESGAASGVMFGLDEAVRIFKRQLGPAAAGEKGE